MLKKVQQANALPMNILIALMPLLWIAGMLSSYTLGGVIHILPFLSLVLFMMKFSGEETTRPGDRGPRLKSKTDKR